MYFYNLHQLLINHKQFLNGVALQEVDGILNFLNKIRKEVQIVSQPSS